MRNLTRNTLIVASALVFALLIPAASAFAQAAPAVRYKGTWEVQPNGDVKVVRTFELPMQLYRTWKEADIHMLEFREFASERSSVEVADRKAEWDDMNRTLTLTMTVMGQVRNMATHWEARMLPGEEFSNIDEGKRTAYFHFAADGPLGRIQGQDLVVLPSGCTNIAWKPAQRAICYVLPEARAAQTPGAAGAKESGSTLALVWWILFAVCGALAALAWACSLLVRFVPRTLTSRAMETPPETA